MVASQRCYRTSVDARAANRNTRVLLLYCRISRSSSGATVGSVVERAGAVTTLVKVSKDVDKMIAEAETRRYFVS